MALVTRLAVGLLALATLLPLLPVGAWWVRLCDFPRMQIGAAVVVPLMGLLVWGTRSGWSIEHGCLLALCLALAAWQFSHVLKYLPLWRKDVPDREASDGASNSVSVANLKFENDNYAEVLEQLRQLDSDVLLLIEVNQAWDEGLEPLKASYPHRAGVVLEEGMGLLLWSKLPLIEPEVKFLVSDKRPSIFAQIEFDAGRTVQFVGIHPTPPGWWDEDEGERNDSRIRDAELLIVADLVAEQPNQDWLITGDFNDVAWSHTTRLFQRISGLKDPRVGRGLFSTFHAQYPLARFPIDHFFVSPTARIDHLDRFLPAGSDHFALTMSFTLDGQQPARPAPEGNDHEQARQMVEEGLDDAEQEQGQPKKN